MKDYPEFNRWLLDLSQLISVNGGVDPGQVPATVLNGSGPPASTLGSNGNLYIDNSGSDLVLRIGLNAEGAGINDASNTRLYAKIAGAWVVIS